MVKDTYKVIGVMSGTSLDGVDLAYLQFDFILNKWHFKILSGTTVPYRKEWVKKLREAVYYSSHELVELNSDYTILLSEIITNFIDQNKIENIDAVCSHGHTILHQPQNRVTLQIGNLPQLSKLIRQKVVCDFRVQDVKLGGQGAPLVPIGDRLLFSEFDYCLNLGGFSNVSFEYKGNRIAYDISPVNTVLNFYAGRLGFEYDNGGELAKSGVLDEKLLKQLNKLDFYKQSFPKSLSVEFVNEKIIPLIEKYSISNQDKLRTFVEHVAIQIGKVIPNERVKMLISGGGAYNLFLMKRIAVNTKQVEVIIPSDATIQYKEALIFGLLGVLKLRDEINVLSSVTGASIDHSGGKIYNV